MAEERSPRRKRPRPGSRTTASVPVELLAKARMIAASRGIDVKDYLEEVMRPAVERDYEGLFDDGPKE